MDNQSGFKDQLKLWKEQAIEIKKSQENDQTPIPEWPKDKITRGHKNFDQILFEGRRKYLVGLDDLSSMRLPVSDQYDRVRFLRQLEADKMISQYRVSYMPREPQKPSTRSFSGSKVIYGEWQN